MIRLILYIILFYLIYHIGKKVLQFLSPPKSNVQGKTIKKTKTFDPKDIEDIEYKEVKRKNEK